MTAFRRTGLRLAVGAAHALVLALALLVAHGLTAIWPALAESESRIFYWLLMGPLGVVLVSPWLALWRGGVSRGGAWRIALVAAVVGYGTAAALTGAALERAAEAHLVGPMGVVAAALIAEACALARAVLAGRRRWAMSLVLAMTLSMIAGWAALGYAAVGARSPRDQVEWATAPANRLVSASLVSVVTLAGLWWLLLMAGARRRLEWVAVFLLAMAAGPATYAWMITWRAPVPTGLARLAPDHNLTTTSPGFFEPEPSKAILGWHSIRKGRTWREALLVQPPCRVTARTTAPAEGPLRLLLTLPRQVLGQADRSVRLHLSVSEPDGRPLGEWRGLLWPSAVAGDAWQSVSVPVAGVARREVAIALEAGGEDPQANASSLPVVAISMIPPAAAESTGPNCLVILVDALRADRLGCYGWRAETSPRIDRLAAEGTVFERVESACSWTVPSVASLFTGAYVATHRVKDYKVMEGPPLPTLAQALRQAGVRTAAVSANPLIDPSGGFSVGFDDFVTSFDGVREETSWARADWVTDQAVALLRQFAGQRFFLYLHYLDPHAPYDPPPGWTSFGWTDEERYLGEILYCDSQVGRLLEELRALGREKDTLVILMSDHGEAFGEHGFRTHGWTLHREEVRVPLILRLAGRIPAGRRVRTQVRTIDIHATVLALMGQAVPRHVEGESLAALLADGGDSTDRRAFGEVEENQGTRPPPLISLSDGHYKLILCLDDGARSLYDLRSDPDEQTDLARQRPDLANPMEQEIRRFLAARPAPKTVRRALTEAEKQRLRALGYLSPGDR